MSGSRWRLVSVVVAGLAAGILTWQTQAARVIYGAGAAVTNSPTGDPAAAKAGAGRKASEPRPAANTAKPAGDRPRPSPAARVEPPKLAASFVPPEGTRAIPHVVKPNESTGALAWRYLPRSVYMRSGELESAIRQANGLGRRRLQPGETILIPGIPLEPILDKPVTVPRDFVARGIYLTAYTAGSTYGLDLIKRWKEAGGNAVVFDIKDYDGEVHVPFEHQYASRGGVTIRDLPKFIHYIHSFHMHAIARIAVFRDAYLAENYPELTVQSRRTGKPWLENGKLAWTDPSKPAVQQYNLDLARTVAAAGADEIQFDYVRFPAEGDQADAQFAYQKDHPDRPRSQVITDFVARAYDTLHPMGVLVSLDVFGVMAWARPVDLRHTGQNIAEMARHTDVISPMIYPSHFFGFDGYQVPGDAPEHFISESMQRFKEATQGTGVVLRPWLQAFGWHTKTYSARYILTQVRVAAQEGGVGYLFWNARNDYSKPFEAMPELQTPATAARAATATENTAKK